MIKSMTSYGRGQSQAGDGAWIVELRTVNSRYLDHHLRVPSGIIGLEERIKKHLATRLVRGRVNLSIKSSGAAQAPPRLVLNRPLVREYRRVLGELREELGVGQEPSLDHFLGNRDLILAEEADPDLDALWEQIVPALDAALDEAEAMRQEEGANLAADLAARLNRLDELFDQVSESAPQVVESYRLRLEERLSKLCENPEVDPQRLAYEVALMADKCDITEEAVRAQSHLAQFRTFLESSEPVGRKMDFLLQELNREANTSGSKLPDAVAGQLVVEIKSELERIREQVQNIE